MHRTCTHRERSHDHNNETKLGMKTRRFIPLKALPAQRIFIQKCATCKIENENHFPFIVECARNSISFHYTHSHGPQHKGILLIRWISLSNGIYVTSSPDARLPLQRRRRSPASNLACLYARCRVRNDDAEEKVKSERTRYYI